jgi:hypothetical protein
VNPNGSFESINSPRRSVINDERNSAAITAGYRSSSIQRARRQNDHAPGPRSANAGPMVANSTLGNRFPCCAKMLRSANITTRDPATEVHNPAIRSAPSAIAQYVENRWSNRLASMEFFDAISNESDTRNQSHEQESDTRRAACKCGK